MKTNDNSKYQGKHILIADGRARQSLPIMRAYKKLGCTVSALCASKLDVAYASRYADHKILGVCDNKLPSETANQILELLKSGKYDVVVPTADFSACLLSQHKEEFSKYAKVASCDIETFSIAMDKVATMKVCMENDIPCPKTVLGAESIEDVLSNGLEFPIAVKPRVGYGAIGFKRVDDAESLIELFEGEDIKVSEYVFQEFIPQTDIQYECAMFVDNNNEVKTSLVFSKNRWFPINGGSSTFNMTVERPDIVESCTKLLKTINWRGAADIDLIIDPRDNIAKIMEINPRMSGSVKICFDAGVDQARQTLEAVFGDEVTEYKTYEIGRRLRCSQTDILWFIKSPNRFKAKPSWFSVYKTRDQIFTWSDPLPYIAFSLSGLLKYKSEMKKRQ